MPRPKQDHQQSDMGERITEAAWRQIAEDGAAALSLRAISRRLGITAPAIYNYFSSRDELVTALVIEAFESLADALAEAAQTRGDDPRERLRQVGLAYRRWAVNYPQRYQLIFGPPLPGYEVPREKVLPSSSRALGVLANLVSASRQAGTLKEGGIPASKIGDQAYFDHFDALGLSIDAKTLTAAVLIWSVLHGIVSLELSGNMLGADAEALLEYQLTVVQGQFFG
jgi:AcrR family transcriptional regulator